MRTILLLSCSSLLLACTSEPPAAPTAVRKGIKIPGATSDSYVLTWDDGTPVAERVPDILDSKIGSYWWVRVDVPRALEPADSYDLTDSKSGLAFAQVYYAQCNPAGLSDADRASCWLLESYTSGEPGLSGTLTVDSDSASVSYELFWEGDTDRFHGPVQHHHRTVSGGFAFEVGE